MLRTLVCIAATIVLSTASQAATPASILCQKLRANFDYLQFDQGACEAAATAYAEFDGAAVKGICGKMSDFYAPAWQANDAADKLSIACFKAATPKIAAPIANANLLEAMCNAFPRPDAGIGSSVDVCKSIAARNVAAGDSASTMLTDSCTGVTSMFDSITAIRFCFSHGIDALGI